MQAPSVASEEQPPGPLASRLKQGALGIRTQLAWAAGAIALWLFLDHALPKGLPIGIVLLGVIYGSIYALLAMGIVLVYRGNRIINFAQAQIGIIPAILGIELNVTYGINFVLSCMIGLVAAIILGAFLSLLPRRFRNSSRLILTVATIGLAQGLGGLSALIPIFFCNPATNPSCATAAAHQTFNTPLHSQFTINPVVFSGNDIVALGGAAVSVIALALFMRRSKYGLAIRAASENGQRATLLGVPVPRLDTIIWVVAAVLATVAILLQTPVLGFGGFQTVTTSSDDVLIRILAAAVIGRMESMPRTAIAALAIGIFDAGATWTYSNTTFVDATLVLVVVAALLLQRRRYSRITEADQSTWRAVAAVRPIPRSLASLPEVRWALRGGKFVLAAVVILLPLVMSDKQSYLASIIAIYAIVGLSLLVLTGWTGQISLGQFGISGLAGAVACDLYAKHGWDFFAALAAAVVIGALVALVIGIPALRIQGPFLAVTTLAFGICASVYLLSPSYLTWLVQTTTNRPNIFGSSTLISSDSGLYYFCLIGFFLCLMAVRSLRRSRIGRSLIATRDNEAAARAAALNTVRQKLTAFLISGAIAGFAGALFVVQQQGVNNGSFTPDIDVALFTMVVIGGLGSLPGVIVGAVAVWGAQYFLPAGWAELVNGGAILLILILLPEGLGGVIYRARDGLLTLVARQRHMSVTGLMLRDLPGTSHVGEGVPAGIPAPAVSGAGGTTPTVSAGGPPAGETRAEPARGAQAAGTVVTLTAPAPPTDERLERDRLSILDPRRLTAPYPVVPLLVLMGFNACLLMSGELIALQIVGIENAYHSALVVLSSAVVQQVQLGLGPDLPVAVFANRRNRWRVAVGGMVVLAAFSVLLGIAGLAPNRVLLYFGVFLLISMSGALTSTQHGALAQYYPVEVRTRVILAHRFVGVAAIALAAPVALLFGTEFSWQAPFLALGAVALALAVIGSRVLPFGPRWRAAGPDPLAASTSAEGPPTLPEATRVLFSVPSIRALYRALALLSVTFFGIGFYTNLLYFNVFHQDAAARRTALDVAAAGGALGVLLAALVLPRLFRSDPTKGMRLVAWGVFVTTLASVVLATSPSFLLTVAANFVFSGAAAWVVAGVYGALSVALPTRLMTLGYALSSIWFVLGVLLVGPVGTVGSTLAAEVGEDFGYRASFWLFAALLALGGGVLHRAGRLLAVDIEHLDASVKADIAVRRDRLEGRGKLLMARGLEAGYDNVRVLFGVDFDIDDGEMVAVLGTNGAGKSTLVKTLCGLIVPTGGEVLFDGQPISTLDPNRIVKLGIAMVPGDRGIFPSLTTADNLRMAGWLYDQDADYMTQATNAVLGYFPVLKLRLDTPAGSLSGGEQQMLSLAMAFIAKPRLLIIDELSLGLAPTVIESLVEIVKEINQRGAAVILVEQSVNLALRMTSRAIFMERGQVVFQGPTSELIEHEEIVRSVLLEGARQQAEGSTTPAGARAQGVGTLGTSLSSLRLDAATAATRSGEPGVVLSAEGIVKRFGGVLAVDDVSLELHNGEILGLIGPNGAGKTTIFEIISGQLRPSAGRVTMNGTDISDWPAYRRSAFGLGRSFQAARLWPGLTVQETISLAVSRRVRSPGVIATMLCSPTVGRAEKKVAAAAEEVIDMLGLGDFKDQLGSDLSTGLRRLLELAVIVAERPSVVLLDEPSAGLAQAETEAMAPVLRDIRAGLRCSLMLIEHDMGLTRALADRIVALDTGAVVAVGAPDEVLRHPRVVESYLGAAAG